MLDIQGPELGDHGQLDNLDLEVPEDAGLDLETDDGLDI